MTTTVKNCNKHDPWNSTTIPVNVAFEGSFAPLHDKSEGLYPIEHYQLLEVDGYWVVIKMVLQEKKLPVVERVCFCLEKDAWEWLRDQGVERE